MNYPLSFQMIKTPWKCLATWVILLVQGPYLWNINLCYKNLGYTIYTTILKNHMKTTLDAIIGKNQSAAIKSRTILHTFASIRDVIYVSHNLNSSLAWTSFNFREPFTGYISILFPSYVCFVTNLLFAS